MSEHEKHPSLDIVESYYDGMKEGIRLYAWWKDGIQYVGTTGTTLKEALDDMDRLVYAVTHSGCEPREIR